MSRNFFNRLYHDKKVFTKGQLKSEWIYETSIFQNSNENIVRISAPKIFTDHILVMYSTFLDSITSNPFGTLCMAQTV